MTAAWIVVAPVRSIIKDTSGFLERIVNDDQHWAHVLDVPVKIDTAVLSLSALNVLYGLKAIGPEHEKARGLRIVRRSPSSKSLADVVNDAAVVTVTALDVIVEATTMHYHEGGALELAMSALASAVRCNMLPPIAAQVRAVGQQMDPDKLTTVLKNLMGYMDKLARFKDPLTVESKLYTEWLNVVGRVGSDDAAVDTSVMSDLLHGHLRAACDPGDVAQDAQEEEATTKFNAAQERLDELTRDFKLGAMGDRIWHDVLDIRQVLSTVNGPVFGG